MDPGGAVRATKMTRKILSVGGAVLAFLLLATTLGWLWLESKWSHWEPPEGPLAETGYQAFTQGALGLEAFPIKYAAVIDTVSGHAFRTTLEDGRTTWQTYGFLDNEKSSDGPACQANAGEWLPHGFAVTNYLPLRALQTPLKFAALTCASCHSGKLRTAAGLTDVITGMGNPELDVIAFTDAVRNAVLDPKLTAGKILEEYDNACPDDETGFLDRLIERQVMRAWLSGIRDVTASDTAKYGLPYHGKQMKDAADIPAGPARTRPFRSIVRVTLDLPAEQNFAFSKIPSVFEQRRDLRPRAQYDGSISDPVTRSFVAVFASGASVLAVSKPEVVHNIRTAAAFTEELGLSIPVPTFNEIFPRNAPNPAQVARGFEVFKSVGCASCHGYRPPGGGSWVTEGARLHRFEYLDGRDGGPRLGVDPERVAFRYAELLPIAIWSKLPGYQETVAEQQKRIEAARDKAQAEGVPAIASFWQRQLDELLLATHPARPADRLFPRRGRSVGRRFGNAGPVPPQIGRSAVLRRVPRRLRARDLRS